MAERLADLEARVASVRQLSTVISAMRGIAAVRSHEANARLAGIRAYAATVGTAIAQSLALLPGRREAAPGGAEKSGRIVIALCAEQGFVGAFNAHVLDAVAGIVGTDAQRHGMTSTQLFLLGGRGRALAEERGITVDWSAPMASRVDQLASLANRLADALFDRLQAGHVCEVAIVYSRPSDAVHPAAVVERRLLPFDYGRFPAVSTSLPPILHLPPAALLARLADEYVFAELCEALTLSYAAENEARMHAMVAARENVARKLDELSARSRRLRQEQITDEVIELAAGVQQTG